MRRSRSSAAFACAPQDPGCWVPEGAAQGGSCWLVAANRRMVVVIGPGLDALDLVIIEEHHLQRQSGTRVKAIDELLLRARAQLGLSIVTGFFCPSLRSGRISRSVSRCEASRGIGLPCALADVTDADGLRRMPPVPRCPGIEQVLDCLS